MSKLSADQLQNHTRAFDGIHPERFKNKRLVITLFVLSFFSRMVMGCSLPEAPIGDIITSPSATSIILPTLTQTGTVVPAATPTEIVPTRTQTSTPTPESGQAASPTPTSEGIPPGGVDEVENPRFIVQTGTPIGMLNVIDPSAGCNWAGIGGQALSRTGAPANNLVIEVGGNIDDEDVLALGLTGSAPNLGGGGFYVKFADQPIASEGSLWLQVFDLAGKAQSRKIYLTTYADCERNLVLINFVETFTSTSYQVVLPFVVKSP